MNIIRRKLTLNQNVGAGTVECVAGCRVSLDAMEIAGLAIPGNPGFTLSCILEGSDVGPDPALFTYTPRKTFNNLVDAIKTDHVFTDIVNAAILNEDARGADEIRAVFTLVNEANGQSIRKRTAKIQILL